MVVYPLATCFVCIVDGQKIFTMNVSFLPFWSLLFLPLFSMYWLICGVSIFSDFLDFLLSTGCFFSCSAPAAFCLARFVNFSICSLVEFLFFYHIFCKALHCLDFLFDVVVRFELHGSVSLSVWIFLKSKLNGKGTKEGKQQGVLFGCPTGLFSLVVLSLFCISFSFLSACLFIYEDMGFWRFLFLHFLRCSFVFHLSNLCWVYVCFVTAFSVASLSLRMGCTLNSWWLISIIVSQFIFVFLLLQIFKIIAFLLLALLSCFLLLYFVAFSPSPFLLFFSGSCWTCFLDWCLECSFPFWNPSSTEDPTLPPDSFFCLDFSHSISFSHVFISGRALFCRAFFRDALRLLSSSRTNHILIVGNAGIGKSAFIPLLLHLLIHQRATAPSSAASACSTAAPKLIPALFVDLQTFHNFAAFASKFDRVVFDDSGNRYLFDLKDRSRPPEVYPARASLSVLNQLNTLYLCDGVAPQPLATVPFTILFSSLKREIWYSFFTHRSPLVLYFPIWTSPELLACFQACYSVC